MSFCLDTYPRRQDIYVRTDGELLFDQQASDERKRSIARRKAQDLKKLLENSSHQSKPKKVNSPSTFSTNAGTASAVSLSTIAFASESKGHLNFATAHAKGANVSAAATANIAAISAANAHATGGNVSASASASAVRVNAANANATGVSASVSATADGLTVSVGNVSVTGVEVAASVSASAAKVQVGNVDVTGASAGVSARVNGAGISAGNIAIGGPSAAASISVDGSLSFGNINIGLRPSLDIGLGLNLGIPFLSGSKLGGSQGDGDGRQPRGLEKLQRDLAAKYPNRRIYANPVDVSIKPNTNGAPIDPLLPKDGPQPMDIDSAAVDDVVNRHQELVKDGKKFVGFKGCPPRSSSTSAQPNPSSTATSTNNNPSNTAGTGSTEPSVWSGMYTSPSPDVAAGYIADDTGRPGDIKRVYLPADATSVYYTKTGLETPEAKIAVTKVKEHSGGKYSFSGPQDSKNPDLFSPETVTSPSVRDEASATGNLKFASSAIEVDRSSYKLTGISQKELDCSQIVPDYLVNIKTTKDCENAGGRERLAHVFQGRPPSGYENSPPKPKELTEDDKLLLEECKKLGLDVPIDELDEWKKKLKSDEEYEREEDARAQADRKPNDGASGESTSKAKEDEEQETEPPQPCKNHPINVRCMKCMNGSTGPRIRKIYGQVYGF